MNTVGVFLVCKLAVGLLQKQRADGSKVRRVWNTRTNHGQASERRVCVISGTSHGTLPLRWQSGQEGVAGIRRAFGGGKASGPAKANSAQDSSASW